MTHDFLHNIKSTHYLHHRARKHGYLKKSIDADHGLVNLYNGRFGRGFTLEYHQPGRGHNFHYIEYWIERGDPRGLLSLSRLKARAQQGDR